MDIRQSLTEVQNPHDDPLQYLLKEKITYGPAQQKLTRSLYLLLFSQGCQTIAIGLLLPILQHEWQLSQFQQSVLIAMVYLGVTIGSYLEIYSDRYGRYNFIMYNALLQCVFGLLSCICWNYSSFLCARFFYGVGIGICLPLSASYITQISPAHIRATLLSKSRVYWSAGCFFTCVLAWVFLRDGMWRVLLFALFLPGVYALYEHWKYGRESLRYLWVTDQREKVCDLVNYMCRLNGQPGLQEQYIYAHMNSAQLNSLKADNQKQIPTKELFNNKYYSSTIRLLLAWITVCFIYYGIMILLPTILEKVFTNANKDPNIKYLFLIVISVFQVAGFGLASFAVDHPSIGRKKGVYYGLYTVCLTSLAIILFGNILLMLLLLMAVIKLAISATFMVLYPYTAQVYETMIRGKALGIASACGRVSIMLMGFVGIYAIDWWEGNGLYVIFIILSAVTGYGGYTMPFCTGNRPIQ